MESVIFGVMGIAGSVAALYFGKELNKRGNLIAIWVLSFAWVFYIAAAAFSDSVAIAVLYGIACAFTAATIGTRSGNHSALPESPKVLAAKQAEIEAKREKRMHDEIMAELMKDLPKH